MGMHLLANGGFGTREPLGTFGCVCLPYVALASQTQIVHSLPRRDIHTFYPPQTNMNPENWPAEDLFKVLRFDSKHTFSFAQGSPSAFVHSPFSPEYCRCRQTLRARAQYVSIKVTRVPKWSQKRRTRMLHQ